LLASQMFCPDKRRPARLSPVGLQRVGVADGGGFFQRQAQNKGMATLWVLFCGNAQLFSGQ